MKTKKTILFTAMLSLIFLGGCSQKEKKSEVNEIQFKTFEVKESFEGDSTFSSISVALSMEYPFDYKDKSILEKLQSSIVRSALGDNAVNDPEPEMKRMAASIVNEHKMRINEVRSNLQLEDGDCISDIYHQTVQSVAFNSDGILSIETADSSHYGGMRGIKSIYYDNYDLRTGEIVTLNDLFIEDFEESLALYITQKLMTDNQLKSARELEEIGFMDVAEIKPSENFCLGEDHITFVFNPSEVACLALGIVKVSIPYNSISFLMKADSPIAALAE